jgi:dienelactone hydrolase
LIYDCPGYGRSSGSPSEEGIFAAAQAALQHLVTLPDVDADRVLLMGYSLGGGPTYELASRSARREAPPG